MSKLHSEDKVHAVSSGLAWLAHRTPLHIKTDKKHYSNYKEELHAYKSSKSTNTFSLRVLPTWLLGGLSDCSQLNPRISALLHNGFWLYVLKRQYVSRHIYQSDGIPPVKRVIRNLPTHIAAMSAPGHVPQFYGMQAHTDSHGAAIVRITWKFLSFVLRLRNSTICWYPHTTAVVDRVGADLSKRSASIRIDYQSIFGLST